MASESFFLSHYLTCLFVSLSLLRSCPTSVGSFFLLHFSFMSHLSHFFLSSLCYSSSSISTLFPSLLYASHSYSPFCIHLCLCVSVSLPVFLSIFPSMLLLPVSCVFPSVFLFLEPLSFHPYFSLFASFPFSLPLSPYLFLLPISIHLSSSSHAPSFRASVVSYSRSSYKYSLRFLSDVASSIDGNVCLRRHSRQRASDQGNEGSAGRRQQGGRGGKHRKTDRQTARQT